MKQVDLKQLVRVTKNYYLSEMTMEEIAELEGISKASVSRIINKAKKLGYVKFTLDLPPIEVEELQAEIKELFQLKHVTVIEAMSNDLNVVYSQLADAMSVYLNEIINDNDTIGVSWGNSMKLISENLSPITEKKNLRLVQLNGGISRHNISSMSNRVMDQFSEKLGAAKYGMSAPSFVDTREIAAILMKDSTINETLALAEQAKVAIFSVGSISDDSVLVKAGYFSKEDYAEMREEGYVGDICSRYFKLDGSHEDGELYNRVIGISLETIRKTPYSLGVVVGKEKAKALLGAINGGYINSLFIEEEVANELINLKKKKMGEKR